MKFRIVDGCPAPASVAPYIYLVLRGAGQQAESIYRGSDAKHLLHKHGKRTQAEIHADPALAHISNEEGHSQHDLHSDGVGNPHVPDGGRLEEWQVGVDSGTNDKVSKDAITHAARRLGFKVKHPYKKGAEGHHWAFATKPRPRGLKQRAQIIHLRATLPRR